MATNIWVALVPIDFNRVRAYNPGDVVSDANVALYGYDTKGWVQQVAVPDPGQVPADPFDARAAALTKDPTSLLSAAQRAALVSSALGAVSRFTAIGHSYVQGDKRTRLGGWLGAGNLTAGSTAIASPTGNGTAVVGQAISGAGIPAGATVTTVTSGAPTAMSLPASGTRTASALSVGAVRAQRWTGRVSAALRAAETNLGKNGSRAWTQGATQGGFATALNEINAFAQAAPYLPTEQVAAVFHGINDLGDYDNLPRLRHALRVIVSRIRAAAVFEETHASHVYTGTWTSTGTAAYNSGGTNRQCTAAASASIAVTMPSDFPAGSVAAFVFSLAGDDQTYSTAGVIRFMRGATVLATMDTRGLMGTTSNIMAACQRISGLAAGDVVNIDFPTPPAYVFYDCWHLEAPAVPLVQLLKQPLLTATGYSVYTAAPITDARVTGMNAMLDSLAAEFADGSVVTVDLSSMDKDLTKFASDQLHPNELGDLEIAEAVLTSIAKNLGSRRGVIAGAPVRGY